MLRVNKRALESQNSGKRLFLYGNREEIENLKELDGRGIKFANEFLFGKGYSIKKAKQSGRHFLVIKTVNGDEVFFGMSKAFQEDESMLYQDELDRAEFHHIPHTVKRDKDGNSVEEEEGVFTGEPTIILGYSGVPDMDDIDVITNEDINELSKNKKEPESVEKD